MLGTSALHMAASPTEDNTVRTKTITPDWYSWEIVRPFPRSHICRNKKKKISFQQSGSWSLSQLLSQKGTPPRNRQFLSA